MKVSTTLLGSGLFAMTLLHGCVSDESLELLSSSNASESVAECLPGAPCGGEDKSLLTGRCQPDPSYDDPAFVKLLCENGDWIYTRPAHLGVNDDFCTYDQATETLKCPRSGSGGSRTIDLNAPCTAPFRSPEIRFETVSDNIPLSQDTLAFIVSGCDRIDGSLYVGSLGGSQSVSGAVERIASVTGDVELEISPGMQRELLPSLEEVGGRVRIQANSGASSLTLGQLVSVGGDFQVVTMNSALTLDVPDLVEIGAAMRLVSPLDSSHNVSFIAPNLREIGNELFFLNTTIAAGAWSTPKLEKIGKALVIDASSLTTFVLPKLNEINGSLLIRDSKLPNAKFEVLARLNGTLSAEQATGFLDLPNLVTMPGSIVVETPGPWILGVNKLASLPSSLRIFAPEPTASVIVSANELITVRGTVTLNVAGYGELKAPKLENVLGSIKLLATTADVNLGSLKTAGSIEIRYLNGALSFPALTVVHGRFAVQDGSSVTEVTANALSNVGSLHVIASPSITGVRLQSLERTGSVLIQGNSKLTLLTMPSLTQVTAPGRFDVMRNNLLPQAQVNAIYAQLPEGTPGTITPNGP